MHLRLATPDDAPAIAPIYNQGIEDRVATFETRLRTPQEIEQWFDGIHPIVVLETDQQIIAFASTSLYRPRSCYAGTSNPRRVLVVRQTGKNARSRTSSHCEMGPVERLESVTRRTEPW